MGDVQLDVVEMPSGSLRVMVRSVRGESGGGLFMSDSLQAQD